MNDKDTLRQKLHAVDFALYELNLYLDTHPASKKAMELLIKYRKAKSELKESYEKKYGKYVYTVHDVPADTETFSWIESPWPWESEE